MSEDDEPYDWRARRRESGVGNGPGKGKRPARSWSPPKRSEPPIVPSLPDDGATSWSTWRPGAHVVSAKPPCTCGKVACAWSRCRCGTLFATCNDCGTSAGKSAVDVVRATRHSHRCEATDAAATAHAAGDPPF